MAVTSQSGSARFSMRIVSMDYYMAPTIPDMDLCSTNFLGAKVEEVPVIRIYGSTPVGQKACLHIHRVLPYLYVPCSDASSQQEGHMFALHMSCSLEEALMQKNHLGMKKRHVHCWNLVRAKKFYGYHSTEELFVKIYLYYPHEVTRAANLLAGGAVLNQTFQPYESHIPYLLQFLVDYNLQGMGLLHLSKVKFRPPLPAHFIPRDSYHCSTRGSESSHYGFAGSEQFKGQADFYSIAFQDSAVWLLSTIPIDWVWLTSSADKQNLATRRQSTCELEGDAAVDDITNQQFVMQTSLSQTREDAKMVQLLVPIWEEYAKTGIHGLAISPDSSRPLPESVLKILREPETEKAFEDLCMAAWKLLSSQAELVEDAKGFMQAVKSISEALSSNQEAAGCSISIEECLMLSESQSYDVSLPVHVCSSEDEKIPSGQIVDSEALELLRWLATSQAADDGCLEDSPFNDTIMTPLLSETNIEEILERVRHDYEILSQKECNDILDSIDGFGFHPDTCNVPSERAVQQLDDSFKDEITYPATVKSSEAHMEEKLHIALHPYSNHVVQARLDSATANLSQMANDSGFFREDMGHNFQSADIQMSPDNNEKTTLSVLSVKDYKKKRHFTGVITSDYQNAEVKPLDMGEKKLQTFASTMDLAVNSTSETEGYGVLPLLFTGENDTEKMAASVNSDDETRNAHGDPCHMNAICTVSSDLCNARKVFDSISCIPVTFDMQNCKLDLLTGGNLALDEAEIPSFAEASERLVYDSSVHTYNLGHEKYEESVRDGVLEGTNTSGHGKMENKRKCTMEYFEMKLNRSAIPNCRKKIPGSSISFDGRQTWLNKDGALNYYIVSTGERNLEDVPLFFESNCVKENGCSTKLMQLEGVPLFQGDVLGVPAYYQNDGSLLYLLTLARSPPSVELMHPCVLTLPPKPHKNIYLKNLQECLDPFLLRSDETFLEKQDIDRIDGGVYDVTEPEIKCLTHSPNLVQSRPNDCVGPCQSDRLAFEIISEVAQQQPVLECHDASQLSGPSRNSFTPLSESGYCDPASVDARQHLLLMSIEVIAESRGDLRSDPRYDAVNIITVALQDDSNPVHETYVLVRETVHSRNIHGVPGCKVMSFSEEKCMINHFGKVVCSLDPDILMGWDIQGGSLGFLAERATCLGIHLLTVISRVAAFEMAHSNANSAHVHTDTNCLVKTETCLVDSAVLKDSVTGSEWGCTHANGLRVSGRIVLNVWRLMCSELKLKIYTLEAVAEKVLQQKVPSIPSKVLTIWFLNGSRNSRFLCIEYVVRRAKLSLQILTQLDLVNRTAELARIYGIDFISVLSRGSQYRVESMYLRLAHSQNYAATSPDPKQVASQPAMECLPLVMEPESGFYGDPVVVLDFQSLYPSMILAYNLCYSTCLGKVTPAKANQLGVSAYSPDLRHLVDLKDHTLLTPNGVMFVSPKIRKGVLPCLLEDILSTRSMVKQAMKKLMPSQKILHRIFNARQLALKLIANVTYGYAAAGFSGRMPCAELADSVVQCGRRTLESAISFVNSYVKWNAKVIYGDTDSMFVLLKGRSVTEAFSIGQEIASMITSLNPNPVALKMEKVYCPCFLLTKKHYVGYSYENVDQVKPVYDAKGIETVRRDTCGAVAKILERSLKIFFESKAIDNVKRYVQRQWMRILRGRMSLEDFVFWKEVRIGTYKNLLPPAAIVASKAMKSDPRAEPRYGERVPYVVIHGEPGARLYDMVADPLHVLEIHSPYQLNDLYYINKQIIPALQRIFGLLGADVNRWFLEMPRPSRAFSGHQVSGSSISSAYNCEDMQRNCRKLYGNRTRIDHYYLSKHCIVCGELLSGPAHLCRECYKNCPVAITAVVGKTSRLEKGLHHLAAICGHCGGADGIEESGVKCNSLACSIFYERKKVQKELQLFSHIAAEIGFYPRCMVEWF